MSIDEVVKVKDLMTRHIVSVSPKTSVMEAAGLMADRDISSVLIKSRDEYIGIITDRDIIKDVVALGLNAKNIMVREIMNDPLITISEEASVNEAAERMRDNKIRKLIVKGKKGVEGIISEFDIVRIEPELFFLVREHTRLMYNPSDSVTPRDIRLAGFCEECDNYSEDLDKVNGKWVCVDCR